MFTFSPFSPSFIYSGKGFVTSKFHFNHDRSPATRASTTAATTSTTTTRTYETLEAFRRSDASVPRHPISAPGFRDVTDESDDSRSDADDADFRSSPRSQRPLLLRLHEADSGCQVRRKNGHSIRTNHVGKCSRHPPVFPLVYSCGLYIM